MAAEEELRLFLGGQCFITLNSAVRSSIRSQIAKVSDHRGELGVRSERGKKASHFSPKRKIALCVEAASRPHESLFSGFCHERQDMAPLKKNEVTKFEGWWAVESGLLT